MKIVDGYVVVKPEKGVSTWPGEPEWPAGWEYEELFAAREVPSETYVMYGCDYGLHECTDEVVTVKHAFNLGERWFIEDAPVHVASDGRYVLPREWAEEHCC